jgi:hypothetical protein
MPRSSGSKRSDGVRTLRERRGREEVTFDDVADHLEDHVRRWPDDADAIERLARFLARVEDVPHDHDGDGATLGG